MHRRGIISRKVGVSPGERAFRSSDALFLADFQPASRSPTSSRACRSERLASGACKKMNMVVHQHSRAKPPPETAHDAIEECGPLLTVPIHRAQLRAAPHREPSHGRYRSRFRSAVAATSNGIPTQDLGDTEPQTNTTETRRATERIASPPCPPPVAPKPLFLTGGSFRNLLLSVVLRVSVVFSGRPMITVDFVKEHVWKWARLQ